MKGLILSGGKGTRLRPLTYTSSKQLIPIANKPIIFYGIEQLVLCGIKDIGIVVGDSKDEIKRIVGNGQKWNVNITYIHQKEPLGIAHAIKVSRDFLEEDDFLLYLGDNLLNDDLRSFIDDFNEKELDEKILLTEVKHPEMFGVVEFKDKKIVRLIEKPKNPPSNLALCGIYIFNKNIHPIIDELKPSHRGEYEITEAIQNLFDKGYKLGYSLVKGWWKDTGKLEDLLAANRIVLDRSLKLNIKLDLDDTVSIEGRVEIGVDCKIHNTLIRGPVIIGNSVEIDSAYIGPYSSIADNCIITHSEIENSIILNDATIRSIKKRIQNSLIGKNASIISHNEKPNAHSFMIGDNSIINLGE